MTLIELDGRTGEGGGQLVRVAISLAALTSQPVKITNVRGNRPAGRGGGLKSQHVTSIAWLAQVTDAQVEGLAVGSQTLTFSPRRPPTELTQRKFTITAETGAASSLLVLQAILPFVLFAGGEPIELEISGGTNVSFSLSFEYFDQVLMPTLEERFGVKIERQLKLRGWSMGPLSRGTISLKVYPIPKGQKLHFTSPPTYIYPDSYQVTNVNVSMILPTASHEKVQQELVKNLADLFPGADVNFKVVEDSASDARWSILLVATSSGGIRWAKDILTSMSKKTKSRDTYAALVSKKLCKDLYEEVMMGGHVDEHLQDQIVAFQSLCDGLSSMPRGDHPGDTEPCVQGGKMRREKNHEPFGHGTMHTQTARWVCSELLPLTEFYNKGDSVRGVGMKHS